jgi:hypothetical protein
MRLIRPRPVNHERRWALALSLGMLLVGMVAILLMTILPGGRLSAIGALGISAALGIGVGLAWLIRALGDGRRPAGEDLARLLAPAFDDAYVLVIAPRLPGVSNDLAALLVGPPGVHAIVARRWSGRYRVRGRAWEYDTKGRDGWIACRTNPSFEAEAVADAVAHWARAAVDESNLAISATVAFPQPQSVIVLEEPGSEVVTTDNAPWFAQRIGRVQRMDAQRVGRFVEAVMDAADATALSEARAAAAAQG